MVKIIRLLAFLAVIVGATRGSAYPRSGPKTAVAPSDLPAKLWVAPANIGSRDLFFGPGGQQDAPHGTTFKFEKEDLDGTNPKFVVRDQDGVKWKIKLGEEARPETAASRLVWAVGYFADQDYFMQNLRVEDLPTHLHRGQNLVGPDGSMHNARLKRYLKGEEKLGEWHWSNSPFANTRDLNGLRVMMALINNWDLKDENNTVYEYKGERIYLVSDLGASFGTTGRSVTRAGSKGNLEAYRNSTFIGRVSEDSVNFKIPTRPALIHIFELPEFVRRVHLEGIGKHIPESDCKWIGQILGRLTRQQIRQAFLAAGYSPAEVDGFSAIVAARIAELNTL